MRAFQLILPLAMIAIPALAQARPAPPPETINVPPEITDPATVDRIGSMMQALSKALLNLPVGEIKAAAEGRPATQADRRETIGDLGRKHDPNFDRNLDRNIEASQHEGLHCRASGDHQEHHRSSPRHRGGHR